MIFAPPPLFQTSLNFEVTDNFSLFLETFSLQMLLEDILLVRLLNDLFLFSSLRLVKSTDLLVENSLTKLNDCFFFTENLLIDQW